MFYNVLPYFKCIATYGSVTDMLQTYQAFCFSLIVSRIVLIVCLLSNLDILLGYVFIDDLEVRLVD